ncbi:MAG: hypothetical protein Q8882_04950, partial [Bacillota bacterium]|nr:hypothetical protein [Bacillota bacterium]
SPENSVIGYAREQNYEAFYENEIAFRKLFDYPPFKQILCITFSGEDENDTKNSCLISESEFRKLFSDTEDLALFKSAPAPLSRIKGRYRYRYWAKANIDGEFRDKLRALLLLHNDKNIRMSIDINPNNMY